MQTLFSPFMLSLVTSGFSPATTDQAQIQHLINRYEAALNASDTNLVLALYGQSPIFMPQHAPAQVGRDAVRSAYDQVFSAIQLNVKFTTHEIEIHGDTAWVRTQSAGETKILANGTLVSEGNNELFIFKKESGTWKIHRYLFATNQPRA